MSMSELLEKISRLEHGPTDQPVVPPPELVGFFVRWTRGLRQWKQSTLAEFASVSVSTIERVERGEKVSNEALERIATALGYGRGYFTEPRLRLLAEQAAENFVEKYGQLEPVNVRPLRTQRQVRELAMCDGCLVHRPNIGSAYDEQVSNLSEWLDLASFILSNPDPREKDRRRELYGSILTCRNTLPITTRHGLISACRKMPHIADPLRAAAAWSPATSWVDFTINTVGFSFRKGQPTLGSAAHPRRTAQARV